MGQHKTTDQRREQFLDTAYALFITKGYEETTVAAIIDSLGLSKGAFYHYFAGKEALLDALAERQAAAIEANLRPLLEDSSLNAPEKLRRIFGQAITYKAENRDFIIELMRVMHDERNLRLRRKLEAGSLESTIPLIAAIIRQGMAERSLQADDPVETARLVLQLGTYLTERISSLLFSAGQTGPVDGGGESSVLRQALAALETYCGALERILGLPPGSMRLEPDGLKILLDGPKGGNK